MKSAEMQEILQQAGDAVAAAAGEDYDASVHVADYTAIANVYPTTAKAAAEVYENNSLLKALGAAGLPTEK